MIGEKKWEVHFRKIKVAAVQAAPDFLDRERTLDKALSLIGSLAEDKKRIGTVYFAIGNNKCFGGMVESSIHLDGLMLKPTVIADNKSRLVENGKLII
jgi:hypothetical protein